MAKFTWLYERFGFTVRQLAEVFFVSPALLIQIQKGKRSLPKKMIIALEHPLFLETSYEPIQDLIWQDEKPEKRIEKWQMRKLELGLKRDKLLAKKEKLETKNRKLQDLIRHTSGPENQFTGRKRLTEDWWKILNKKASLDLEEMKIEDWEAVQLALALVEKEMMMIDGFLKD